MVNPKKVVRKLLPKTAARVSAEIYRRSRAVGLQARYGFPAHNLRVIAVTGTNGKTTTCNFINEMLKSSGYKTALFTTAFFEFNGKREVNDTHRTVPLMAQFLGFLKRAEAEGAEFVIFEATSQALDQHKLWAIHPEVAVLTNLTQEHLDYHGTMQAYAAAKARLFNGYAKSKHAVLNRDDEWFDFFKRQSVGQVASYGQHPDSSARITEVKLTNSGGDFKLGRLKLHTHLMGEFNVYNAAAAASVGLALGLSGEQITKGIAALQAVPGRMEHIDAGQPFKVIVDYAVTPDALENALKSLKKATKGRLIVVFGATGDRDRTKRPLMGQIAAKYADLIFLCDDETYTEDPAKIRAEVMVGITQAGGASKTHEIGDRGEAIKTALKTAKAGDIVLIPGIGHQTTRNMGGKDISWNERQIVRDLLKKL